MKIFNLTLIYQGVPLIFLLLQAPVMCVLGLVYMCHGCGQLYGSAAG